MCRPLLVALLATLTICCGDDSPTAPTGSVVDFGGVWSGTWLRQSCSETAGTVTVGCAGLPTSEALRVTLTQTGDQVQGRVDVGVFLVTVTGTVGSDSVLRLTGEGRILTTAFRLSNWQTTQSGGTMTGSFTFAFVPDDPTFATITFTASLQNVTRQ
jgi:hypothetical protein